MVFLELVQYSWDGLPGFDILRRGQGVPRLRARPKGAALWNPAAFEKAAETFFCASRASLQPLIRKRGSNISSFDSRPSLTEKAADFNTFTGVF